MEILAHAICLTIGMFIGAVACRYLLDSPPDLPVLFGFWLGSVVTFAVEKGLHP